MDNIPELLCDEREMNAAVKRLACGIGKVLAPHPGDGALVGIHQQGVPLAERIRKHLQEDFGFSPDFGTLDISMYRDDIGNRSRLPLIRETRIPFDVNDKFIILVDDVLSSGRTIRAALDALTDYGRPRLIRLAVLVDRGEPEFPIRADFIGMKFAVPPDHKIRVRFEPGQDGDPGIYDIRWPK